MNLKDTQERKEEAGLLRAPPGPRGHFVGNNLREYTTDPLGFLSGCAREYGDVVKLRLMGQTFYLLSHPDLANSRSGDAYRLRVGLGGGGSGEEITSIGRNSAVTLRQPNAVTARNIGTTTSTAAIRHAVENPLEAECTICGHSPESHIPMEPRYGYRATNAATRSANITRVVRPGFTVAGVYSIT
jgi:hypothetical protein